MIEKCYSYEIRQAVVSILFREDEGFVPLLAPADDLVRDIKDVDVHFLDVACSETEFALELERGLNSSL